MRTFMWNKEMLAVILHTLLRPVVPFMAIIACLFMRKIERKTTHYGQDGSIQRYTLPKIFNFMLTFDEDLAGGMYEPTVKKIYDRFGAYWCSVYWIGLRNQAQGLLWLFGYEVTEQVYLCNKLSDYKLMNKDIDLKLFKLRYGWEIAHDHYLDYTTTGYYAIPQIKIVKRN